MNPMVDCRADLAGRPRRAEQATRRDLMAALPLAAAALGAAVWPRSEDTLPRGKEAARLASTIAKASWFRPTCFAHAVEHSASGRLLTELLESYAQMHLARLGRTASAAHLLSVADLILAGPYSYRALFAWRADRRGFRPDKFFTIWRRARVIELERHEIQLTRLRAALR
ncbi:MAG: hypothetical protein ACR2FH_07105 [Caulobacteraceae bacterium]